MTYPFLHRDPHRHSEVANLTVYHCFFQQLYISRVLSMLKVADVQADQIIGRKVAL